MRISLYLGLKAWMLMLAIALLPMSAMADDDGRIPPPDNPTATPKPTPKPHASSDSTALDSKVLKIFQTAMITNLMQQKT